MESEKLRDLLERYVDGKCTEEERAWIEDWYNRYHLKASEPYTQEQIEADAKALWTRLPATPGKVLFKTWYKYVGIAAAMLLTYLAINKYLLIDWAKRNEMPLHAKLEQVLPGSNRATLTLGNGKVISLDEMANGVLAQQPGIIISKNADGIIIYKIEKAQQGTTAGNAQYNTISTPRGGHYQVQLPDGTKVWLNAASTLTYSTGPATNKREVRLSGEAYFEVAHDTQRPFVVETQRQIVEVLGTHFNVNSYADNASTVTTLLQGKVKVSLSNKSTSGSNVVLVPGQSATVHLQSLTVARADIMQAVAWKNGRIEFSDAPLPEVMRMLGRWYDINIRVEGNLPPRRFSGSIPNNKNLYRVLEALQLGNINFDLLEENGGRTLVLKP